MTAKLRRFLADARPATPCLVIDLDVVAENYATLRRTLPEADVFYAIKANPERQVVERLRDLGSSFDAATIHEIEQAMDAGVPAERISFGNTVKKRDDIARAHRLGIDLFAFDSEAELGKLARAAPGARVFCRLVMTGAGADWPLGRKFGCEPDMAHDLMLRAAEAGLVPYGLSFHVGSQQRDPGQWDVAIGQAAALFARLEARGVALRMLNVGGGFPAHYRPEVPTAEAYAAAVDGAVARHFGDRRPRMIIEPGRSLVGDAGILQSEVVLIAHKGYDDPVRWIYLDVGKFGGLIETMGEAIQYRITTPHDGGPTGPVILAGPTCDEMDVMYQHSGYELPLDLRIGDRIEFLSTGAYTASYSSVCFNGIPPLAVHCI